MNGGLGVATILLAMLFAATTGVVGASETAIGFLAVPAMLKARYSQSLASGCVCAGGTLGILIPPQHHAHFIRPHGRRLRPADVCGRHHSGASDGRQLRALRHHSLCHQPGTGSWRPIRPEGQTAVHGNPWLKGSNTCCPPGFWFSWYLGSIFFGVASPTEAGAVGSIGSILLSVVYGRFTWKDFKENCYNHPPCHLHDHLHCHRGQHVHPVHS